MARKVWAVAFDTVHAVELVHGTKSGSRSITVDGAPIELGAEAKRFVDSGSVHAFKVDDRPMEVHIEPVGFGRWYYRLKADDRWLDPPLPPRRLPAWSLAFVALAVFPAVALFGTDSSKVAMLIGLATAAGASFAILANARDPLLSLDRKVVKCGLLAALVWGVLALPGWMMVGAMKLMGS